MRRMIYILSAVFFLNGCNSWLDVQPYDRVAEDVAFGSVTGFENALNGIYIELNRDVLYGRYLSTEMIELMAQRYNANKATTYYFDVMDYAYTESNCESRFSSVWSKFYNLIANVNLLLKNCDAHRDILSDEYYSLIKGEAYALRGMMHFDLFRLFGPLYNTEDQTKLPYYKEFDLNKRPYCLPEHFMDNVITDLDTALVFLQNDPVLTEGGRNVNSYAFTSHRNLRLNYYAVQLLKARAELYRNNKSAALEAAMKVINAQEEWFPWVKREAISSGKEDADRVFYTEIIFGLQNPSLSKVFTALFDATNLGADILLAPLSQQVSKIFDNNQDDYRYEAYLRNIKMVGGTNYSVFEKYRTTQDTLAGTILPMLRVSEAFYIAAECEPVPADGLVWLNKVLRHRGVAEVENEQLLTRTLEKEYLREFWGEGQLFYFYKRLQYPEIRVADDPAYSRTIEMLANYKVPIPEDETKYN